MTIPLRNHPLFAHIVDYAGTFPPANLAQDAAAANYVSERAGPDGWLLGRFVVPARAAPDIPVDSIELSVVTGADPRAALAYVEAFNAQRQSRVASIEFSPVPASDIASLANMTGGAGAGIEAFFETPIDGDLPARLDAIFRAGAAAKVRTGGITPASIPGTAALAEFLRECARRRLPFKATAGLHHLVRSCYPLTYERDSPTAVMHGFLNVLAAAALAATDADATEIKATLEASSVRSLMQTALAQDPAATRRLFRSFGSCSFREPADELARVLADLKVGTT